MAGRAAGQPHLQGTDGQRAVIDYSVLKFAKQKPKALDKQAKQQAIEAKDKAENAKARKRAKGRCEVHELWPLPCPVTQSARYVRCPNKDVHTHHLLSGIGRRNIGRSVLAEYKIRVCEKCHADIHAKVLQPTTAEHDAASVRYRRVR
jgi:hypothetical protein